MEEKGKVLEINLSTFIPRKEFYITWLKKAAKHKELNFSIVFDFHSLEQLKDLDKKEPLAELSDIKNKGRARAIKRLLDLIDLLDGLGVGAERIINSSRPNLDSFLSSRNKRKK